MHVKRDRPFTFARCSNCGVHFLENDDNGLDVYTGEKRDTVVVEGERRYVHWDDDIVRALQARGANGRLLDFGSGDGHLLRAAREAGFAAEGLDVSPSFAEVARAHSGCEVFVGPLEEAPYEPGRFGVVNAHFALEYVPNPRTTMKRLAEILKPGGWLRAFGSVTDSVAARLRGAAWWNYASTRRFLFSQKTMQFLAKAAGLELVDVVHGGEQTSGHYLQGQPAESSRLARDIADLARFHVERLRVGPVSLGSSRAFYMRKPS
jgi:SAM-dependent methyltransferase